MDLQPHELMVWAGFAIPALWLLWVIIWVFAALRTKPIVQRYDLRERLPYRLPLIASMVLLLLGRRTHLARLLLAAVPTASWLYGRFIPLYAGLVLLGAPLVLMGLSVAVWARFYLGRNWSSSVTFKQDHELVRSGPYRYVRHPIYTGILVAVAGTAFAIGQWRGVAGFVLTFFGLWYKSRLEERLMLEHFGDEYRRYLREVRALIPFLF